MRDDLSTQNATLLIVDDETYVINSLKRLFRAKPYRILTAQDGDSALRILEENTVDVVLTDSRMPRMDGPTLLSHIQRRWPDCMRILLTGQLDIGAAIKAINEGEIYRYISKPWDDRELCSAVDEALAYQYLQRDRARLLRLTHEQNTQLQEINATLEARVERRTAELAQTASLLTLAHENLQRSYLTATEVFASLISHRLPGSRQTNQEINALVVAFCRARQVSKPLADDLSMAAALYNIGKLTWNDALIALPAQQLDKEQSKKYRTYPQMGETLLMALEPAEGAATIIRHHQERWDGRGFPDGLSGDAIPLGARILKMAVDFVEMQMGMQLRRKLSRDEVLGVMSRYAGRLYDPILCEPFLEVASRLPNDEEAEDEKTLVLGVHALEPRMILVKDLHTEGGMLLLKQGVALTERLIDKLGYLQENQDTKYSLHVRLADPEDDE